MLTGVWLLLPLFQAELPAAPPGWNVEVLARAPDVRHPTAVAVGPDGRVYVGEDPQDMEGPVDAKIGRVLCLHPDGRRTVFAEGLGPVFGLAWHADRLLVHDCFRLAAYRDEDGVGRDAREVLPATHPEPSRGNRYNTHIPAGFRLSPDGHFYMGVGDKGIQNLRGPDGRTLSLRGGGVIRFRPDGSGLEVFATGLRNAMDVAITRQGHIFAFDNDDNAAWGARVIHVVEGGDYGYPWDRGRPWVLPAIHEARGIPAGCVGATGVGLPADWQDNVLLCEWGRSEIIRYRFEPAGASFRIAARETVFRRGGGEFRPVGIAAGADGRSFVVSDWNTAARRVKTAAGRVLRFTWTGPPGAPPAPTAGPAPDPDPFARHAAALALHRKIAGQPATLDALGVEAAGPALRGIYDPRAVALAARAGDLDLLGELLFKPRPWDGTWWGTRAALNPQIRADVAWEGTEAARAALVAALDDPSPARRLIAARALRADRASAGSLRTHLGKETDPAARRELFGALVAQSDPEVEPLAARAIEDGDPALLAAACAAVRSPEPAARALEQRADPLLLATLARTRGPHGPAARLLSHKSAEVRAAAVQALADLDARETVPALIALGAEGLPALVRMPDAGAINLYVAGLGGRAAEVRIGCARAIAALGRDTRSVLESRADTLPEAVLAELQRIYAASPEGPLFRKRVERPGLEALLARALSAPGAPARGQMLFHDPAVLGCSRCHWAEGRGGDIGPELDMVGAVYDRRTLAESVLFPSRIIHGAYRQTSVKLRSGGIVSGLLRKETAGELALLDAEGRTWTVRKADIEARKLAEVSTMPEGLADALTPDEFADLVAYLGALRGEQVEFRRGEGRLEIVVAGEAVGTYEWADRAVLRPFFANLRSGGIALTRPHPPVGGSDHATMHPGIWLAFGDLSGADFWRNKGRVEHVRFVEEPRDGSFAVLNRYRSGDRAIAEETCRVTVRPAPEGFMLLIDSRLVPVDAPLEFGDQEEMGLGVRLATPLAVKSGGRLLDSEGRSGEKQVWGKTADWCDAGGVVEGRRSGLLVLADPANFRKSWMHARDYGLLVANPFGLKAFTKGEPSRVIVKKGEELRLRFAILAYRSASADGPDLAAAARALSAALPVR